MGIEPTFRLILRVTWGGMPHSKPPAQSSRAGGCQCHGSCQNSKGDHDAGITNKAPLFAEPCCQLCEHTLQRTRTVTKSLNRTTHDLGHGNPEVCNRSFFGMLIIPVGF